jgi:hypothetical protein
MAETRLGPTAIIQFVDATGTITLHSKYRTATMNDNNNLIETTSGADLAKTYIAGIAEWGCDVEYVFQGTDSTLGTADLKRLKSGGTGLLNVGPLGSATNSLKQYGNVIIESRQIPLPYDELSMISISFKGNGALTDGAW